MEAETNSKPTEGRGFARLPAEEQVAQVRELDRQEVESRTADGLTPDQLWAQWRSYVARQESKEPPEPAIVTEFSLVMGLSMGDLYAYSERGRDYARVVKKIHHDQVQRIERRLIRGQGTIGAIFWLKNRAGFRDKSPEESQAAGDDWLTRLLTSKLVAQDRPGNPPQPADPMQLVDSQDDTPETNPPEPLVMTGS